MRSCFRVGFVLVTASLLFLASEAEAVDQEAINKAIDKGVAHLKQLQREDGTWPYTDAGATSLAALTLLECGVSPADSALQKAAQVIRESSLTCTHTYSISLAILFLDRLGDPGDVPLIESLSVRLLAGQNGTGGWAYHCPPIPQTEVVRLRQTLQRPKEGQTKATPNKRELPREIKAQLEIIDQSVANVMQRGTGDNSNTQFATLALWVARRHGMPVEKALARVEERFRASQGMDGGWGYGNHPDATFLLMRQEPSSPAMTCAGLLGIGINRGIALEAVAKKNATQAPPKLDPNQDPAIKAGLNLLAQAIDHPVAHKKGANHQVPIYTHGGKNYYTLWSLERVGVTYGLKEIGGKDWYGFGAEILVANQQADGSWQGDFAAYGADTCFALLFLKRANLAKDLTASLIGEHPAMHLPDPPVLKKPSLPVVPVAPPPSGAPKPGIGTPSINPVPARTPDDKIKLLPLALGNSSESEAQQLAAELKMARPDRQTEIVEKFRGRKETCYARALAAVIPNLADVSKSRARDVLAELMKPMSTAVLRQSLCDNCSEIRLASVRALGLKEDRSVVPHLIQALEDKDVYVVKAAHSALKLLTNQDFGPVDETNRSECSKAVVAWKAWWSKENR